MTTKPKRKLTPEDEVVRKNLNRLYDGWKRRNPKMKQDEIAEMLGWESQSIVSQHLRGHTPVRLEAVIRWAKFLGVKPSEIKPDIDNYIDDMARQKPITLDTGTGKTLVLEALSDPTYLSLSSGQKDLFEKVIEALVIYLEENSIKLKGKIFAKLIITIYIECLTVNEDPTNKIIEKFIYLAT